MNNANPLINIWTSPFGIPPFSDIRPEHFIPAIENAISLAESELKRIEENPEEASFQNTIEALESSGKLLNRVASCLFNLNSAETSPEIQEASSKASALLTRFSNDITLNPILFKKVKSVYDDTDWSALSTEEGILLKEKYRDFRNGGSELPDNQKQRFRKVSETLAELSVKFEKNLLKETNSFELHLVNKKDVDGLPEGLLEAASQIAKEKGKDGWIFTLHYPSYVPFMQYSKNRELRKKMLLAFSSRCFKNNSYNNEKIVRDIVNLRLELANLLGFDTYADFVLEDRMASSSKMVNTFLSNLFSESRQYAINDYETLRTFAFDKGHKDDLERWDWAFYSEFMKREKYAIDDEILKPYFELDNVEEAIFKLATSLYGLNFLELNEAPKYHHEVKTYEVRDENDEHLAILMTDYHPREGKSGGAWMTAYREQFNDSEGDTRPLISIVMNFSRSTPGKPALLTHNELTTLLHEFGHALHGMLSKCRYESNSGTNVKRDFVELPSQIMENWAFEKEWLNTWARHYDTGETIPGELIDKLRSSLQYNEGYACNRQLSFGMLDMAWHSLSEPFNDSLSEFENSAISSTELFKPLEGTSQSCAFGHLFSGGYAAGYYGYKWAEVLDADAFSIFKKKGIFDRKTAASFKENILEMGGSDDPMILYRNFKGSEPDIEAFLERSGFKDSSEGI